MLLLSVFEMNILFRNDWLKEGSYSISNISTNISPKSIAHFFLLSQQIFTKHLLCVNTNSDTVNYGWREEMILYLNDVTFQIVQVNHKHLKKNIIFWLWELFYVTWIIVFRTWIRVSINTINSTGNLKAFSLRRHLILDLNI